MDQKYVEIFWSHVDKSGPCWIWTASVGSHGSGSGSGYGSGYGSVQTGRRRD